MLKPRQHVSASGLIAHCAGIIGKHKLPRDVTFVCELPLTASGKIQRFALREMLATMKDHAGENARGREKENDVNA